MTVFASAATVSPERTSYSSSKLFVPTPAGPDADLELGLPSRSGARKSISTRARIMCSTSAPNRSR